LTGALALAFASAAWTQPGPRIEVLESGLYTAEVEKRLQDPAVLGLRSVVRNVQFYDKTSRVPGRLGTRFGFRYRVRGIAADQAVELAKLTVFPPPGLTDPRRGRSHAANRSVIRVKGETPFTTGYSFDEPWEIVPGEWRIELWYGGRKLVEQRYTVVR
jgi:Domain of unknown function (DUF3859)